jgi:hypothetical protein
VDRFFANLGDYRDDIRSLITDNFHSCLRTFLSRFSWVIVVLIKHKRRPA